MDKVKKPSYTAKCVGDAGRAQIVQQLLPMDLLQRYASLPRAERMVEVKTMLRDVFRRLEEHGGASPDELRQLAEALVEEYEKKPRRKAAAV